MPSLAVLLVLPIDQYPLGMAETHERPQVDEKGINLDSRVLVSTTRISMLLTMILQVSLSQTRAGNSENQAGFGPFVSIELRNMTELLPSGGKVTWSRS